MPDFLNTTASIVGILSAAIASAYWLWQRRPTKFGRPTLIYVSMGGTCRDPMAKAVTDFLLKDRRPRIAVIAAGILKGHQKGASPAARSVVQERLGYDALKSHRSKVLSPLFIRRAKLILTMTKENKSQILRAHPDASEKVYTLKEFLGQKGEIKNPYVQNDLLSAAATARYRVCYDELFELLSADGNIDKIYYAVCAA